MIFGLATLLGGVNKQKFKVNLKILFFSIFWSYSALMLVIVVPF